MIKELMKKGYEVVKASEEGKHLAYVPYGDHVKVLKSLKRKDLKHSIRFNHNYSLAIIYF